MELSVSRSGRFTPGKVPPGAHRLGGRVGPKDGLDVFGKRNIYCLYLDLKPGHFD